MTKETSARTPSETPRPAPPEQPRALERREQLLTAAVRLLLEGGAPAVTHRRVAEEGDSSPGSVRYHFRTSEDLLAACLEEIERTRAGEAGRIIDLLGRSDEGLDEPQTAWLVLRAYYGPEIDDVTITRMTWMIIDCGRESPRLAQLLGRHRQKANQDIGEILRSCGYPDLRPSQAAAMLDGGILTAMVEGLSPVAESAVAGLAEVLGLLNRRN